VSRSRPKLALVFVVIAATLIGFLLWQRRTIDSIARNWSDFTDGSDLARQLKNPNDVLAYIARFPDQVSLAAFDAGDEEHGIFLNADRRRPLASTMKIMLLCEYARALDAGEWQPGEPVSISDWEANWLPKVDGNAHERTFAQVREGKYIAEGKVQLQDVVYGLIRYSDNAAADYLMQRMGRARVNALPAQLGMPDADAPWPISGMFLSWQSTREHTQAKELVQRYSALAPAAYADLAWRLAEQLRADPELLAAEQKRVTVDGLKLRLSEQAALASATSVHGSARDYARLMARIKLGELPGSAPMQAELEWPMQHAITRERFASLGSKGGSLPGIATSATYAIGRGKTRVRVLALFFEGLPIAVWMRMMESFVQQDFETKLLADDAFFAYVKQHVDALH
jgi:D-alanyl-D-alanine carboxypeptidase